MVEAGLENRVNVFIIWGFVFPSPWQIFKPLAIFLKLVILQVWIFASNGFVGQPRAKRRYHGLMNMGGDWTWKIHSPVKKVVSVWTLREERNKLQQKTNAEMQKEKRATVK